MARIAGVFTIAVVLACFVMPAQGVAGPALSVDLTQPTHPISPYIYGMNFAEPILAAELNLPLNRWGGNDTSRYSYLLDTSSKGMDWFFANIPYRIEEGQPARPLPEEARVERYIRANQSWGGETIVTMPMLGWMPKAEAYDCSYTRADYPDQTEFDPWHDCGNGLLPGGVRITGNNPDRSSVPVGPAFVTAWMQRLVSRYGTAQNGGVRFYNLDNEPMLWNDTHRDVRQTPLSYDELRDLTYAYASAIKAVDPSAMTLGPVGFGWTEYFYSALDMAAGGAWWQNPVDRLAHGNKPLAEWYLEQMAAYEAAHHIRILDYFDEHFYPQNGVALNDDVSTPEIRSLRLRSTRALWDPTYGDESWISDGTDGVPVMLIPRMKQWVSENYPGTKTAITEYNWGALNHINGALAQADILGIFGREGLDLAALWAPPLGEQPGAYAFRMYLNYDGTGSDFGDTSVYASSANQGKLAIYAATRSDDGALTLMVINKTPETQTSVVSINGFSAQPVAEVWQYSPANLNAIVRAPDVPVAGSEIIRDFPANSITLLVLRPQSMPPVELLTNGSFESALSGWTIANPTADKVKCDPALPTKFAHSGVCGLKLTGTAGAITKIRQPLTVLVGDAGDTVSLAVWAKGRALNAIVQVKAVLNTSAGQQLVKRKLPPGTYGFSHQSNSAVIGGTLLSGSVQIIVRPGTGKIFVDDVSLQIFESSAQPVLPLPAPADNF
jgi:hypothetical protein